jgi:hypothetical protein
MYKIFARKRADIFVRADAIAANSDKASFVFLGDLVGLGDLAGVAAGGTLSFSSTAMTTDVRGLAHFD